MINYKCRLFKSVKLWHDCDLLPYMSRIYQHFSNNPTNIVNTMAIDQHHNRKPLLWNGSSCEIGYLTATKSISYTKLYLVF